MKVRKGGGEEIPLLQGKEQRLRFAGAAIEEIPHAQGKRNPSKMVGVARGHQRADTLKPHSQKTSQCNHTRTTAAATAATAATKSNQSCLTLCDPIDGSPTGSSVPGILQARTLEWVAISFTNHESEK